MQDLTKHLVGHFKGRESGREEFMRSFKDLLYATREEDFSSKWDEILQGASPQIAEYMRKRLGERKEKWGGPWVWMKLTLGLSTTQLVEDQEVPQESPDLFV